MDETVWEDFLFFWFSFFFNYFKIYETVMNKHRQNDISVCCLCRRVIVERPNARQKRRSTQPTRGQLCCVYRYRTFKGETHNTQNTHKKCIL
jgi:hypothetical protein